MPHNGERFSKAEFTIDLERQVVSCPEGAEAPIRAGKAEFEAERCDACPARGECTRAKPGHGRSISIHPQEALLIELRELKSTSEGRAVLRQRVAVEHRLAHLCRRQGPRARYKGERMNVFDILRTSAVENLLVLDGRQEAV